MCSGSERKPGSTMEGEIEIKESLRCSFSIVLELAASNDLIGFRKAVEEEGHDVNGSILWYGRRIGSKKMGYEERTPLMIASMFGSKEVLAYILETPRADVTLFSGSDGTSALHCAVAGCSAVSAQIIKLLLDASADVNIVDANGNRPCDLITRCYNSTFNAKKKLLEALLNGSVVDSETVSLSEQMVNGRGPEMPEILKTRATKDGTEKKEYPVDLSLPDIKNGIYSTDEFRMYIFKVKPCSRAYSHDWTECPFVHPGENARRRDPRKYHYSCVPCPEFRKGTCKQGDACEYAHGIFECWLHPAQYRTRLCKDEAGCKRRVCFFAHTQEELRPLYPSTGSAVPSPRGLSGSSMDLGSISPLAWPTQPNMAAPTLQLPGSRLKAALAARDMDFDELLGLESQLRGQQKLIDEISGLSSPSSWGNGLSAASAFSPSGDVTGELNRLGIINPTDLDDIFVSRDLSNLSPLQGLSLDAASPEPSPTAIQMRQSLNAHLRPGYNMSVPSSPVRASQMYVIDTSVASVLNSRSAAFAKRSQSFIERSAVKRQSGLASPAASATAMPSSLLEWGSPDGKLDWGIQGEELNKLRKSASFRLSSASSLGATSVATAKEAIDEPDLSWVQSLVKDAPSGEPGVPGLEEQQQLCHLDNGDLEMLPAWVEQLYLEQEQLVA